MPRFDIQLKPSVEKDLRKLPATVIRQVFDAFEKLSEEPSVPSDRKLTGTIYIKKSSTRNKCLWKNQ